MKLRSYKLSDREYLWYADFVRTPMGSSIEVMSFHGKGFVVLEDCTPAYEFPTWIDVEKIGISQRTALSGSLFGREIKKRKEVM